MKAYQAAIRRKGEEAAAGGREAMEAALRFVMDVFGVDEDDAAERYAAEIQAGTIQQSDPCTTPIWRSVGLVPSARWARPNELTDDELQDAIHHLALTSGREPLPRDADSDALAVEITAVRGEIAADTTSIRLGL